MNMEKETLGAHLRNLLTPYKNLLQLAKDGKADEETIRKYNLDNLDELITFSNSEAMEQKNPEPASEDLEEAADCYKDMITPEEVDDTEHAYSYETYTEYQIADAFKAGAQWQKEKDESDDNLYAIHLEKWGITGECPSELEAKIDAKFGITDRDSNGKPSNGYCDWKKDVFTNGPSIYSFAKLGMDYQKEQMMKGAIEGRLGSTVTGSEQYVSAYVGYGEYGKDGDKVKVIIIKE